MPNPDFKQGLSLIGKVLASGQLSATTATTVYTVPASSAVKLATASVTNIGTATVTVTVAVVPAGSSVDATRTVAVFPLAANESTKLTEIEGAMLDAGTVISITASTAAAINYLVTGSVSA